MGKCGGRELNYVSDVDVIFVAEPMDDGDEATAMRTATELASSMMRACSDHTAEGTIWPVDAALRPEGRSGRLVRTLASHPRITEPGPRPGSSRRCSKRDQSPGTCSSARHMWIRCNR